LTWPPSHYSMKYKAHHYAVISSHVLLLPA
jgi:hypothetical protein